jgi:hypothetical protein
MGGIVPMPDEILGTIENFYYRLAGHRPISVKY